MGLSIIMKKLPARTLLKFPLKNQNRTLIQKKTFMGFARWEHGNKYLSANRIKNVQSERVTLTTKKMN